MRFKLDENLDIRLKQTFTAAGHEVDTVYDEGVSGTTDDELYALCLREGRALITQDLDFSNPFVFDPLPTRGIVVFRNPSQLLRNLERLARLLLSRLHDESPEGHIWVIGETGIRIWPA